MSEHWPPEWGEPDDDDLDNDIEQLDAGQPASGRLDPAPRAERLAEVTSALAALPAPALPDVFAARISAAIVAEAATRPPAAGATGDSATARSPSSESSRPAAAGPGTPAAPPARSRRPGARRGSGRSGTSRAPGPAGPRPGRRGLRRLASARAIGSLVACLVVAGFGFLIVHAPSSSSSSSAASAAGGAVSAAASASASAARPLLGQPEAGRSSQSSGSSFGVRATGTRYAPSTLAGQVRAALRTTTGGYSSSGTEPAASAASATRAPTAALAGCVRGLTAGVTPSLVDRASYAGKPAYVIAVASRAWVVRPGCTAANPELIRTVALAGLSGNLCALGSV